METPAGFVEALFDNAKNFRELSRQTSSNQEIIQEIFRGKTLLCIDNYDSIQIIDSWLNTEKRYLYSLIRVTLLSPLTLTGASPLTVTRRTTRC
jgi:hypothetical protein